MVETYILIIIIMITYVFTKMLKLKDGIFLKICFLEFFMILILRQPVSDLIKYIQAFHSMSDLSFSQITIWGWEYGYLLLNKIISILTTNERIFIVIIAIITLAGPYIFIKKYSKNYLFSIILYIGLMFFHLQYYIIRQAIAMTILLISIRFIEKKQFIKFLLCIVIATSFHLSSLIFIILYFIGDKPIKKRTIMCFMTLYIILLTFGGYLSDFFYIFYKEYVNIEKTSSGIVLLLLFGIFFIIIVSLENLANKEKDNSQKINNIFYRMFLIAIAFQTLAIYNTSLSRLIYYFSISIIILLPNVIKDAKNKNLEITCVVIVFFILMMYSIISPVAFPYELFWVT